MKLFLLMIVSLFSTNVRKAGLDIEDCKSAILIESTTKSIMYDKNSNERLAPASMTKIMTLTLIMEEIANNNLKYDDIVTTSPLAASQTGSRIFLSVNEKMCVYDLLKGIAIASANDASVAMAEKISGNVESFVAKMNEYAKKLGLTNTSFKNPTGLTEENHFSSAYDMAIMAANLVNKFPKILELTSIYQDYLRQDTKSPFWLVNTNKLVRFESGVDGLKTGWTEEAGYCLTATKMQNGMRLIGVLMGCLNTSERNSQMVSMLNYGFSNYKIYETNLCRKSIKKIHDIKYEPSEFNVVVKKEHRLLVTSNFDEKKLVYKYILNEKNIKKGENPVGECHIFLENALIGKETLVIDCKVRKREVFCMFKEVMKEIFKL